MARSEASLAAVLLTQRLVDGQAEPLKASEYWALVDQVADPADVLDRSPESLVADLGFDAALADRVASRVAQATQVVFALDESEQSGLRVVTSVDDDYPCSLTSRLGTAAPPLLYVAGDAALLSTGGLGVVGSRNVEPEAAEVAKAAARLAAEQGMTVISGGAKGVDRLAMGAALDSSGRAVGVLAESLTRTVKDPDVRRAIVDGALCLCTPYKPSAGFSVATAMGRNKLIYALSTATLVVASDKAKGGTWAGAIEALRHRYGRVVVWTGEGAASGNAAIVERGGVPLDDLQRLFPLEAADDPDTAHAVRDDAPSQLILEI